MYAAYVVVRVKIVDGCSVIDMIFVVCEMDNVVIVFFDNVFVMVDDVELKCNCMVLCVVVVSLSLGVLDFVEFLGGL